MGKKRIKKKTTIFNGQDNPFNLKVNRTKHSVLGQHISGTKGKPVISRGASYTKRKNLWQKTKIRALKANHFLDQRQMNEPMPLDNHAAKMLIREHKKKTKKNIFNLNDDEELVHKALPLKNAKKFGKIDHCEDDEQMGTSVANRAHFGEPSAETPLSHKEAMKQLIKGNKLMKYEKQLGNDQNAELTEQLDKDWKSMLLVMPGMKLFENSKEIVIEKADPFDIIANELKFEPRGTATTRIKTDDEIAREKKAKKEELEREMRLRMIDTSVKDVGEINHLSADSLYDAFDFQHIDNEDTEVQEVLEESADDNEYDEEKEDDSEESESGMESSDEFEADKSEDEIQLDTKFGGKNHQTSKSIDATVLCHIPQSMEALVSLIDQCEPGKLYKHIDNITKNHRNSQSEKVLAQLEVFFDVLLQYSVECCVDKFKICGILAQNLHTLFSVSSQKMAEKFLLLLDKERNLFVKMRQQKKRANFPRVQTLFLFKLCSELYSVSDFRHPVVTPAMIFMGDVLGNIFYPTPQNIISRLFICNIVLDCVRVSKRFFPESITFLNKILESASKDTTSAFGAKFDFILEEMQASDNINELSVLQSNLTSMNDPTKLSILYNTIRLLNEFASLYIYLPSFKEIFSETLTHAKKLPMEFYPPMLKNSITKLMLAIESSSCILKYLVYQNVKPKPLKLFEPRFDSKFDNRDELNQKRNSIKKVNKKIKREEKGMLREMRRDAQMIAAEKLKERLEDDAERKAKVKKLYAELAMQEGEYKKMMKGKL